LNEIPPPAAIRANCDVKPFDVRMGTVQFISKDVGQNGVEDLRALSARFG
jgi:hypothetical protein